MSGLFSIEMLPAREGDCLLISYGEDSKLRRILIDAGRAATYSDLKRRFAQLPHDQREFELLIVTHVDRDHIEGILDLVEDPNLPVRFKEVWFNGFHHLKFGDLETFGAVQGERFTAGLTLHHWPWNQIFDGGPVMTDDHREPVAMPLEGGMVLYLLSPNRAKLTALAPVWEKECEKAGIVAGQAGRPDGPPGFERFGSIDIDRLAETPFDPDGSRANGSSIAVLAEFDGRRALLAGDAHVDRLIESLKSFAAPGGGRVPIDAFKIPHHGSKHNLSRELLELIDCKTYLVSTNGSYFNHPNPETIARIIKFGGDSRRIHFNYRSEETTIWDNPAWQRRYGYATSYPVDDGSITVSL